MITALTNILIFLFNISLYYLPLFFHTLTKSLIFVKILMSIIFILIYNFIYVLCYQLKRIALTIIKLCVNYKQFYLMRIYYAI